MSKEKQIKEMAKVIGENIDRVDKLAEALYNAGYRKQSENTVEVPCKVDQTVYKICPKCNEHHNASCKHCAWSGCLGFGCDIGVSVYSDGSYNECALQIVPRKVTKYNIITILELWNIMYFATEEEANTAKDEYDTIRNIQDKHERYEAYKAWENERKQHYAFVKGGAE